MRTLDISEMAFVAGGDPPSEEVVVVNGTSSTGTHAYGYHPQTVMDAMARDFLLSSVPAEILADDILMSFEDALGAEDVDFIGNSIGETSLPSSGYSILQSWSTSQVGWKSAIAVKKSTNAVSFYVDTDHDGSYDREKLLYVIN